MEGLSPAHWAKTIPAEDCNASSFENIPRRRDHRHFGGVLICVLTSFGAGLQRA
jgi:hypothetical protein